MDNFYNNVAKMPALDAKHMPQGLEALARALVNSGRFRVDCINKQNFVRWNRPAEGVNLMFSHREIFDPQLIPRTAATMWDILASAYHQSDLKWKVESELQRLRADAKKNIDVDAETEIKLARLIVQAAEPPVIMLVLAEYTEVFVSYSYMVGDMLDIQTWKEAGDSSGLQSTKQLGCSVFVACGGNPLVPEKKVARPNDGFYALSRLMVIAGQELAHYSDIIRDGPRRGSRFSANWHIGRATEIARIGRLADIANVKAIWTKIESVGLKQVTEAERQLKFYKEHRKRSLTLLATQIKVWIYQVGFILLCEMRKLDFLRSFYKDKYTCTKITLMLGDMLFNLQPDADAYKRPDPHEEEMIMCIEALARVQQQANKWGKSVTGVMYPNLYKLYYMEILPACIKSYEKISGKPFPAMWMGGR
jgi:hypothetical protein